PAAAPRRVIVAITGATGAVYGVRLLQVLGAVPQGETHLLISPAGVMNLQHELEIGKAEVEALADVVHNVRDIGATI
ncbi:flavoprotein, partial [Acinetobacter baumannii]